MPKKGRIDSTILRYLLSHPYLRKPPPKSTGREEFGQPFWKKLLQRAQKRSLSLEDTLATCCRFLALSIGGSQTWIPEDIHEVIIGGGGIYNATLVKELKDAFASAPVRTMDECGSHSKAFEGIAFAILAYQSYHGVCSNVPSVTGARHPVVLGTIVPGQQKKRIS